MKKKYWFYLLIIIVVVVTTGFFYAFNSKAAWPEIFDKIYPEHKVAYADLPLLVSKCLYDKVELYYFKAATSEGINVLYNEEGKYVCAPDGGLNGQGDGLCPDKQPKDSCHEIWVNPLYLK